MSLHAHVAIIHVVDGEYAQSCRNEGSTPVMLLVPLADKSVDTYSGADVGF